MKKFLNTFKYLLILIMILGIFVAPKAFADTQWWFQSAPNVLMTNTTGGLATADIHVAHCYIGTGTSTPCGGGGSGTITGSGTANQVSYFTGSSAIGSDSSLTYTANSGVLNVGTGYDIAGAGFATINGSDVYLGTYPASGVLSNKNVVLGQGAGAALVTGALQNVIIGENSVGKALTPVSVVAIGHSIFNTAAGTDIDDVVLGDTAARNVASLSNSVVIGYEAEMNNGGTATNNVIVGNNADQSNNTGNISQLTILGASTYSGGFNNVGILGYGLTATGASQVVIGNANNTATDTYFGNGVTATTPSSLNLQPTGGLGSNVAGSSFLIAGSKGTGTGIPGTIGFATSTAGSSGSTLQTLTTRGFVDGMGNLNWGSGFTLNSSGNITELNGAVTNFPSANAAGFLKNDGSGNLTYTTTGIGTITGSGTANQVSYFTGSSAIGSDSGLTYTASSGVLGTTSGYNINGSFFANQIAGSGDICIGSGTDGCGSSPDNTTLGVGTAIGGDNHDTLIGADSQSSANNDSELGFNSHGGGASVSIGVNAGSSSIGFQDVLIGDGANSAGGKSVVLGMSTNGQSADAVVIGGGLATTAADQTVIGNINSTTTSKAYFGDGVTNATATPNVTIGVTGGSGSNNIGGNLLLSGGISTGNSTPAVIGFETGTATTSGSTAQTLSIRGGVDGSGNLNWGTSTTNFTVNSSGKVSEQNGDTTVGDGVATVVGSVALASQIPANGAFQIGTPTTTGLYDIDVYVTLTNADITAGTDVIGISWTDTAGSKTYSFVTALNLAVSGGYTTFDIPIEDVGGDAINFTQALTGIAATSRISFRTTATRVQ